MYVKKQHIKFIKAYAVMDKCKDNVKGKKCCIAFSDEQLCVLYHKFYIISCRPEQQKCGTIWSGAPRVRRDHAGSKPCIGT